MSETAINLAELDVEGVVDPNAEFAGGALRAVKLLARSKPWRGEFEKRFADFKACLDGLVKTYELAPITLKHECSRFGCSGGSDVSHDGRTIMLRGRLSVVTLLHLFAKARQIQSGRWLGPDVHFAAIRWSVSLFSRKFPISFSRCRLVNGLLVNDSRRDD